MNYEPRQDPIDVPRGSTLPIEDGAGVPLNPAQRFGRALRKFGASLLAPLLRPDTTTF